MIPFIPFWYSATISLKIATQKKYLDREVLMTNLIIYLHSISACSPIVRFVWQGAN